MLDYRGSEEVTSAARRTVEKAIQEIERHFGWGQDWVLFTIGYSPQYFERYYDGSMPVGLVPTMVPR